MNTSICIANLRFYAGFFSQIILGNLKGFWFRDWGDWGDWWDWLVSGL